MSIIKVNREFLQADYVGALASGLCVVHCLATPLLFIVQAGTSCGEAGPWWWSIIDFFFLAISAVAVWKSAKNSQRRWLSIALYISWVVLALLLINHRLHLMTLPHILLYGPALALVGFHIYNLRGCQCVDDGCCVSEEIVETESGKYRQKKFNDNDVVPLGPQHFYRFDLLNSFPEGRRVYSCDSILNNVANADEDISQ